MADLLGGRLPFFMDSYIPSSKAAACPSSISHWASISVPGTSTACSTSRRIVWTCWQVSSADSCCGSMGFDLVPVLRCGDDRFAQGSAIHLVLTGLNQPPQVLDDARPLRQACVLCRGSEPRLTSQIDTVRRCRERRLANCGTVFGL